MELHPQEVRQQLRVPGLQDGPLPAVVRRCPALGPPADLQQHQASERSSAKEVYDCQVSRFITELSYDLRTRVCAVPSGVCALVPSGVSL